MLTQQIIRQEIEDLKRIITSDELEIPSLWECAKPGVVIFLWLFICPFVAFNISGAILSDTLSAVGFSTFLGFIMFFLAINGCGYILSIPRRFREESKVIIMLRGKLKKYLIVYMSTILILAFVGAFSRAGALSYLLPMMFVTVAFAFFFNADISRYKLSALSEVIKSVSAKKRS